MYLVRVGLSRELDLVLKSACVVRAEGETSPDQRVRHHTDRPGQYTAAQLRTNVIDVAAVCYSFRDGSAARAQDEVACPTLLSLPKEGRHPQKGYMFTDDQTKTDRYTTGNALRSKSAPFGRPWHSSVKA